MACFWAVGLNQVVSSLASHKACLKPSFPDTILVLLDALLDAIRGEFCVISFKAFQQKISAKIYVGTSIAPKFESVMSSTTYGDHGPLIMGVSWAGASAASLLLSLRAYSKVAKLCKDPGYSIYWAAWAYAGQSGTYLMSELADTIDCISDFCHC